MISKFKNRQKRKAVYIYLIASAVFLLISLLYFWMNPNGFENVIMTDFNFSDYFYHIIFSSMPNQTYRMSYDACFPPLAYCFYYLLWKLRPIPVERKGQWEQIKTEDNVMLVFVLVQILLAILLFYLITRYLKEESIEVQLLCTVLIICSYPYLGTSLQRGNSVAFVSILIGFAWIFRQSESKALREVALIFIAVAAGFKIYPAIVGLIYVKEKRYKETIRLLVYGIAFFFGPFAIYGGMTGLKNFLGLLIAREQELPTIWGTVRGAGNNVLMSIFHLEPEISVPIAVGIETVFLIVCLVLFFCAKENWKMLFYLSMILIAYIPTNLMYTSVYLLPSFLGFLLEKGYLDIYRKTDYIYLLGYIVIFSLPALFVMLGMSSYMTFVITMYGMFACSVLEDFTGIVKLVTERERKAAG